MIENTQDFVEAVNLPVVPESFAKFLSPDLRLKDPAYLKQRASYSFKYQPLSFIGLGGPTPTEVSAKNDRLPQHFHGQLNKTSPTQNGSINSCSGSSKVSSSQNRKSFYIQPFKSPLHSPVDKSYRQKGVVFTSPKMHKSSTTLNMPVSPMFNQKVSPFISFSPGSSNRKFSVEDKHYNTPQKVVENNSVLFSSFFFFFLNLLYIYRMNMVKKLYIYHSQSTTFMERPSLIGR
jgi:hypothetical protein